MTLVMSAGPRNVACKPVSDAGANTTDPMMTVAMEISKRFIFWRLRVEVGFKSKGISPGNREQYEWRSGRSLLSFFMANNLAISDVARLFGLRTSAIRYYERIGILPPPLRKNGQRWYEESVLFRLAVVQRARETGDHSPGVVRADHAQYQPQVTADHARASRRGCGKEPA